MDAKVTLRSLQCSPNRDKMGIVAETNGGGRMDRIEATLDQLAERQKEFAIIQERAHEEFARDHKQLMTWQVLMQEKMETDRAEQRRPSASTG